MLESPTSLPLNGKTILITRSAGQSSQFTKLLQQQGATVLEMPAIEIGPPSSWAALDDAIAHLQDFDWLILTSTNGVDYFFERLTACGKDSAALKNLKIAVVGRKTAGSLKKQGLEPDFIPPDFVADSLVETFPEAPLDGLKILFPRVETGGRDVLVQQFTAKGAIVTEVAAYQSCCAQSIPPHVVEALQNNKIDIITFASSKTVQCFHQLLTTLSTADGHDLTPHTPHPTPHTLPSQICIASIGPQTSTACIERLGRVDVEAEEYTLEGLTQAIARWVNVRDGEYELRQR
ncbi:MAG TPA: uroporphyrinogen-III synthase [Crinalium sp.]|jgi:uroporphyrinogen-III synthase